eukprot:137604-Rhodomonas_salina.1
MFKELKEVVRRRASTTERTPSFERLLELRLSFSNECIAVRAPASGMDPALPHLFASKRRFLRRLQWCSGGPITSNEASSSAHSLKSKCSREVRVWKRGENARAP